MYETSLRGDHGLVKVRSGEVVFIYRNGPNGLKCYFIFRMIFFFFTRHYLVSVQLKISLLTFICCFTGFVRTQPVKQLIHNFLTFESDSKLHRWMYVKLRSD